MSNFMHDVPCPDCGEQVIACDLRGKWRGLHGGYYCYRCHSCHKCWEDRALRQSVDEPALFHADPQPIAEEAQDD